MAALTRTIAGVDVADVEGWLTKKKQRKALNALTGAATRRWFCVARVSPPIIEDLHSQQQLWRDPCRSVLALCYYASREASESPRGWIYLADVRGLRAVDDAALAIEYPKRTYVLVAPDGPRRDRWVKGLAQIASHARTAEGAAAALPPLAAPGLASPADDLDSVFSPCGRRAEAGDRRDDRLPDDIPRRRRGARDDRDHDRLEALDVVFRRTRDSDRDVRRSRDSDRDRDRDYDRDYDRDVVPAEVHALVAAVLLLAEESEVAGHRERRLVLGARRVRQVNGDDVARLGRRDERALRAHVVPDVLGRVSVERALLKVAEERELVDGRRLRARRISTRRTRRRAEVRNAGSGRAPPARGGGRRRAAASSWLACGRADVFYELPIARL